MLQIEHRVDDVVVAQACHEGREQQTLHLGQLLLCVEVGGTITGCACGWVRLHEVLLRVRIVGRSSQDVAVVGGVRVLSLSHRTYCNVGLGYVVWFFSVLVCLFVVCCVFVVRCVFAVCTQCTDYIHCTCTHYTLYSTSVCLFVVSCHLSLAALYSLYSAAWTVLPSAHEYYLCGDCKFSSHVHRCERSSFFVLRSSFFVLHSAFFVLRSSLFVVRCSFFVLRSSFFVLRSSFFVSSCLLDSSFFALRSRVIATDPNLVSGSLCKFYSFVGCSLLFVCWLFVVGCCAVCCCRLWFVVCRHLPFAVWAIEATGIGCVNTACAGCCGYLL
jgi:hypothetical protein